MNRFVLEIKPIEEEPGYLLGTATIFGVFHHVEFIRVVYNEQTQCQEAWQPPADPQMQLVPVEERVYDSDYIYDTNYNAERLEKLDAYDECFHETVNVPGFDGDYVCVITPYGR